jgi:lipoprotein-anchoring transpeptidase ErfK/SrfK
MRRRHWTAGELTLAVLGAAAVGFAIFALVSSSGGGAQANDKPLAPAVAARRGIYQELAALTAPHQAFTAPGGRRLRWVDATRPITSEQTVLPVLQTSSRGSVGWLQVELPGRPNGLTGWIQSSGTKLEYTRWRLVVNTAARRVYAYEGSQLVRSFSAVVGAPTTPTPRGRFFVEESVAEPRSAVGYPYALALSARSDVFQEFDGGPGQIALHGLDNVGGTPGTAASHGCIRLTTGDITWLAHRINPGVPVIIN